MALWAALITGAVGVAGIAGTILAARMVARNQTSNLVLSINEQRDSARLVDKRQAYANYMAALHRFEVMMMATMAEVYYIETDPEKIRSAVLEIFAKNSAIYDRLSELELIGSEAVIIQAQALKSRVMSFMAEIPVDDNGVIDIPAVESWDAQIDQLEKELHKTMRAELARQGGTSLATGERQAAGATESQWVAQRHSPALLLTPIRRLLTANICHERSARLWTMTLA